VVLVRSLKNKAEVENVLYTINTLPKDPDDYAKILLNVERPDEEGELLLLINE